MQKACFCLSTRTGSLLFLYYFLLDKTWEILSISTNMGDPLYKEFLKDNAYIYYIAIFFASIGSLIFLAAVVSICNKTPSISLLSTSVAFLLLTTFFDIYCTFLYTTNGVYDKIWDAEIEKKIRSSDLPLHVRNEKRIKMKSMYPDMLKITYISMGLQVVIVLYSVLVLFNYMAELRENSVDAPVRKNIKDKVANFSQLPTCILEFDNPQYFAQPPEYSVQAPRASAEPTAKH